LPAAVKRELVDDVLENEDAPENHRQSARAIESLVEGGYLAVRSPDFEAYGTVVDEARRRIADDSLPEHDVQADQYMPALVCELAPDHTVQLVTADRKLRRIVRDVTTRRGVDESVTIADPRTVL
jgi:hypothetical protein